MATHICKKCGRKFKSSEEFNEHARKNTPRTLMPNETFAEFSARCEAMGKCKTR